jgi:uncharacterized protein (DUF1501 family)
MNKNDRRNFIKSTLAGSAAISLSGSIPGMLLGASRPRDTDQKEKILVVVQLSGGNDGLNTVVPYGDDQYYKNRFTLAINKSNVLKIDDHVGFHPALTGFDELLQNNQLSVVQGVGYENPNRSHFESMDLWHTAHRIEEESELGWLGRTVESGISNSGWQSDLPAVHFGGGLQPLALKTENNPIPSIRSIDQFKLKLFQDRKAKQQLAKLVSSKPKSENPLLNYVYDSANVAIETSHRLEKLNSKKRSSEFKYPQSSLGRNLGTIAQLIGSGLSTRVYYTSLDGFDTHSNQGESHASLLRDLGNSVNAFMKQIDAQGNGERVCLFSFSEFGRRVRENASRGTDHGTAAPVFVCGSKIDKALVGKHPSLKDLDQGDLKYQIDYRSIYNELLENWLGVDAASIVKSKPKRIKLFG